MKRTLEKELLKWKERKNRYPLLLRGARQVGKTYLIESFGKSNFESFISINFEAQAEASACFESLDPEEIIIKLQSILKKHIYPGKTLLFLDEIQVCPRAILALRYFKEKLPSLHIIAAGSLLEFSLIDGKFSFPVGRIEFMYLKPFSFQEYLNARNKQINLSEIAKNSIDCDTHNEMLKYVKEYFLVGGMPAAIESFCNDLNLNESRRIQEILLATYQADFSKYATKSTQKYLKIILPGIFQNLTQQFKYSKIDSHVRARELKQALDHLHYSGLIYFVYSSSASGFPLAVQIKNNRFKVIFLDIGLVQNALKIDPTIILEKDLIQLNKGAMAEQFVGQELLAYSNPYQEHQLYYWQREKKGSEAEIDYLYTLDSHILPIEVKAGSTGRLRSLKQFMQEKRSKIGIRISENPLSFEKNILSIPFYLISQLPNILKRFL